MGRTVALFRGKTRTTSHSEYHGFVEHGGTGSFGEDGGGCCFFGDFSLNLRIGGWVRMNRVICDPVYILPDR